MSKREAIKPIGPSIAYIPLTQDQFALVDFEDADYLSQWNWYALWSPKSKSFYAFRHASRITEDGQVVIGMHAAVTNASRESYPDHIYHRTLDNRKSQIRVGSQSDNMFNARYPLGTSGHKGVSFRKDKRKWEAYIGGRGNRVRIGYFDNLKSAVDARRLAECAR